MAAIGLLALTVLPNAFALAGDTIAVRLASGRQFSGELDARTDSDRLWLRFGGLNASLIRPIQWSTVESITVAGETVTQADLLERVPTAEPAVPSGEVSNGAVVTRNVSLRLDHASLATEALAPQSRVTHIDFYANLANWDGDPQPDGLLLHVTLLDANQQPVEARGSLQAELYAPVQRRFSAVVHGRGVSVLPIARWSNAIDQEDFRDGLAVIELPFTAVTRGSTGLATPYGLLHVKVAVPGHGVFEASYDGLRVEKFAPTRDLSQRQGRGRTVFTEPPAHGSIGR